MTDTRSFFVTGGAGFVGSHTVRALLDCGAEVVVVDDLSSGHRSAVPADAELVVADFASPAVLEDLLPSRTWHAVFHFAALTQVGESMRQPFRYLRENSAKGIALIDACVRHGIRRFVLSSTAALFNSTSNDAISEDCRPDPQSPYGESKAMLERALHWAQVCHGLRSARLRYFNAAGADVDGRLGEDHDPESHLVPLVIDAALDRRPPLQIFGNTYPTQDGTCIRDYVHVADLADAHLLALCGLDRDPELTWNLGNGSGYSVLEVIRSVERVTGRRVPFEFGARRDGDAAVLIAGSDRARAAGWNPRFGALDDIVRTAYAWRLAHPRGYGD